jgi:hypothetical protein
MDREDDFVHQKKTRLSRAVAEIFLDISLYES